MYSDIAGQKSFQDYTGPARDFDHGVQYFVKKFKSCLIDDVMNDSFIHVTDATDTNNMEFVLDSTRTIIITQVIYDFVIFALSLAQNVLLYPHLKSLLPLAKSHLEPETV